MTVKRDIKASWNAATKLVHAGQSRSQFKETSETIYMSSGYVYETAEEAEAAFDNSQPRFVYSRFGNPTRLDVREPHGGHRRCRSRARHIVRHGCGVCGDCQPGENRRPHRGVRRPLRVLPVHPR